MPTYKLAKVGKMGDYDEKYGQTFWGSTEDGTNLMFNSKTQYIPDGATVTALEETDKTTKDGSKQYKRLSKVTVDTDAPQPESHQGADFAQLMQKTIRIEKMLKEVLEIVKTGSLDDNDDPDLSDIPW